VTEPLTPPECDLRGMPFMPVDIVRLFDSDLYALSTGDEFKAAFTLWGKAFLQVPAGSLPDDDRILAHLSGAGARWRKLRDMALRGWVRCTDGRLYHPVVAEKARDAWQARLAQRARTEAARAARAAKRQDSDSSNTPPVTTPVATSVTENVTGSKGQGQGQLRREEPASLDAAASPIDARQALWGDGLIRLRRITGQGDRQARGLLGRMVRDAGDDCALVAALLHQAEADRIGDPVPWLTSAIKARTGQRSAAPKRESNLAWMHGMLGTAPEPPPAFDLDLTAEEIRR
jgi:hypothetical protein